MKRIELGDVLSNGDTVSLEYVEQALGKVTQPENFCLPDVQHDWRVLGAWVERGPNWESTSNKRTKETQYGFPKYGRSMYCVLTETRRRMTIDEFYCG